MKAVWLAETSPGFYAAADFIAHRIYGTEKDMPGQTIMAVAHDGAIVAAAIFQNYSKEYGTIEISAASDDKRWMTRRTLWEMFDYCFHQLGCQAAILRTDPDDKALSRILHRYGFDQYLIPRLRGRDKPEMISVLSDDAWRANGFHKENAHG